MNEKPLRKRWRKSKRVALAMMIVYALVISCGQPADRLILQPPAPQVKGLDGGRCRAPVMPVVVPLWLAQGKGRAAGGGLPAARRSSAT